MGALIDLWQRRLAKYDVAMVYMIVRRRISRTELGEIRDGLRALADDIDKALNTPDHTG